MITVLGMPAWVFFIACILGGFFWSAGTSLWNAVLAAFNRPRA